VASFKLRSLGGRSGSWVSAELSPNLAGSVGDQSGVTAVRIEGKWTTFLFGGLDDSMVERLNAWRAWATSDPTTPPLSLEPARHELFPTVVVLEYGSASLSAWRSPPFWQPVPWAASSTSLAA
jgi:hypothetical protein